MVEFITILYYVVMIVGAFGTYKVYTTIENKIAGMAKNWAYLPVIALFAFGLLQVGGLKWVSPAFGPLAAGEIAPIEGEVAPEVAPEVIPGITVPGVPEPVKAKKLQISTFNIQLKEKYSNAYDQVGDATNGTLKIYDQAVNPADPTAKAIVEINITSGTATKTNPNIVTDKNYRVVFDGGEEWYTKDYGIITFPYADFNPNTGVYLFDKDSISRMATIADTLDETTTGGDVNGQTTNSADNELYNTTTTDTLYYNRSTGDGSWYIKPEISVSGALREIQKLVWCYTWDVDNPPDGNEISSIVYQHETGTPLAAMPSEQIALWSTQSCVQIGDNVKGGTTSKFRITVTQDDTEIDDNDVWAMRIDDLGDFQGKDIILNTGRPYDSIIIDSTA